MPNGNKNKQLIGFFGFAGLVGLIAVFLVWPFWQMLALAGIFAVLFYPIYQKLLKESGSENWAAIFSVIIVLIAGILPLWLVGQVLFNQIVDVYNQFRLGELVFNQSNLAAFLPDQFKEIATTLSNDINAIFSRLSGSAFDLVTSLLSNIASFFLSLFLVIFMIFFFLRDGKRLKSYIQEISPLSDIYSKTIVQRLENAISGVVKGAFLIALIQGVVATVGFLIFGVPQAFLWGAATVVAALVPTVGTSLSIIPAVIFLIITGQTGQAVGLMIWGVVAVGLVDNIVGPKLVGSRVQLHPLLVLLSVLGGIQLFGFLGFLFGPILMSVFVTLVDIYRTELKSEI